MTTIYDPGRETKNFVSFAAIESADLPARSLSLIRDFAVFANF